ncbi:ATP-dependent RNA helicase CsdA [Desulfocicer vacuolatum DSM 3385]|uniref:ATP-dependent RNA helicase DeaD n=1 Tax=Desulfocicer vacuolatum DSM 3385 TaxID=1121400 RepID=A0A1W2E909_9BACT|nr:DEAD/DEAH box helicase [Desulfocicer vacuolatum]SMD06234.1 ATP-dependent RNA helicase CsdA [Desulfocicer vacuolatum DSM 3385]
MSQNDPPLIGFDEMNLSPSLCNALQDVGYKTPTPIQSLTIPHLLQGRDVLGQARTGTGKTAAFALPLLSRIDLANRKPQILVLAPTRELAIQVTESFKTYGARMKGLSVLSVYGGQSYGIQLTALKRGVHVVVGTPGRLMDHLQRKTLNFSDLFCVVLDEADEMLHMGFIEDVQWILDRTPKNAQTALFSATMPGPIRKIAQKYLTDPKEVLVRSDVDVISTINQQFWLVKGEKKSNALIRILEATTFDGVIVFARTRVATVEVAKSLEERGFKAEALNGDMAQTARERTIARLKNGHIDILVATDVAARGLDVERISHVINYDMPSKVDPYVHRIGRTGRAGRTGEAILFLNRNERWMIRNIERATKQKIKQMLLPSNRDINEKRIKDFKDGITQTLASEDLSVFQELVEAYALEHDVSVAQVAAALGKRAHGSAAFLLPARESHGKKGPGHGARKSASVRKPRTDREAFRDNDTTGRGRGHRERGKALRDQELSPGKGGSRQKEEVFERNAQKGKINSRTVREEPLLKTEKGRDHAGERKSREKRRMPPLERGMERFRIEVGRQHGVQPKDIVGAIANEAGLESKYIGSIDIHPEFSLVDLPTGMPKVVFRGLKKTWVRSRQMAISKYM